MTYQPPIVQAQKNGRVLVEALPAGGLAYLLCTAHAAARERQRFVVVCADEERAERLQLDLESLGVPDVAFLPGQEHVPFADVAADSAVSFARCALRQRLLQHDAPAYLVTSASAVQARWPSAAVFAKHTRTYQSGAEIDRDALCAHLVLCGYQPVNFVEDEGTFALRGGVIDVFVPAAAMPRRIDLFGDEIASIKSFEPESQRTFETFQQLCIFPIREVIFSDEAVTHAVSWLKSLGESTDLPSRRLRAVRESIGQRNYFYGVEALWPAFYAQSDAVLPTLLGANTTLVLDDPAAIRSQNDDFYRRAEKERASLLEKQNPAVEVAQHLLDSDTMRAQLCSEPRFESVPLTLDAGDQKARVAHGLSATRDLVDEMAARRKDPSRGEILDPVIKAVANRAARAASTYLCCNSLGSAERLREIMLGRKIDLPLWHGFHSALYGRDANLPRQRGQALSQKFHCAIVVAPLAHSFADATQDVLVLSDVDIFAAAVRRRKSARRRKAPTDGLNTLRDLREGDPVIHQDHGIGRYLGLKRLILGGVDGDYVLLEYADGDKLYLPVYRLNMLQRYRGPGEHVRLDKLGGSRWDRAKQRVKDAVLAIAHELLALQAQRKLRPGFALPQAAAAYQAFAASFPYEETVDQQRAIDDVLQDLQKDTPMDRLICGDVGFGKTEVAMRAAFLAVHGNRQVAVLVPTTVLAEQHRATFEERLAPFGVVVEVLSRFRTAKETQDILRRLQAGAVDVIVGTHRMLSADVQFKNLGLLVVDEEQRFGVKHKERIKQLRHQVHVLTLSATPIPRTLHMASVGLRDLSLITTPPAERSAIRTEIMRFDEAMVAEAINRELHRGGQVFVVHNRVQSIEAMADLVRRVVPEAQVAMAHGQMSGDTLERIMVGFVRRETNVLVCTAIIESGIDIPSANTMIVNRADTFGLSQLYQLRGRIGRGNVRAYAYLMLPRSDALSKEATQRLAVLKRFSELGAGFQIASHDLELRGAGDLLGADQSGSIAAVGFELYTELLAEAVERARGQKDSSHSVEPDIKVPVAAVLPEKYIPEPMQRLALYQRMAQADNDVGIYNILAEVVDLYGTAPEEAENLAEVMVLRRRLKSLGASALAVGADGANLKIGLTFIIEATIDRADLVMRCQKEPSHYRLLPSGRLAITVVGSGPLEGKALLQVIRNELGQLKRLGPAEAEPLT